MANVVAATKPTVIACDFNTPHVGIKNVDNVTTANITIYFNKFSLFNTLFLSIFFTSSFNSSNSFHYNLMYIKNTLIIT